MFTMELASRTLTSLARSCEYSVNRTRGFAHAVSWKPTSVCGAVVYYADGTTEVFTVDDLAKEARDGN
jgi:hypothetical protein